MGCKMQKKPSSEEGFRVAETERATLGGGCFWCLEPLFAALRGVVSVQPGYAGGHVSNPSYERVCSGSTGHAEVVEITFGPDQITYRDLLEIFFAMHDPTTPNRQGADVGTQYRSVIFYHSPQQKEMASEVMAALHPDGSWERDTVVTELVPYTAFYPAEDYHRDYYNRNPGRGYCRAVIAPKVEKFRKCFAGRVGTPL